MSRTISPPKFQLALIAFIGTCCALTGLNGRSESTSPEMARFLANLDLERYQRKGSQVTDPEMSPFRILPKLTDHDRTFHYDFERLTATEQRLRGVDRRTALQAIFARVTLGRQTHRERHLAMLKFLHQSSFHNLIQPMRPDGRMVSDPLVLLELGEMRCGQVNRLAIDLFRSVGYRGRLVQVAFHVLAEIFYDDSWHYFDGDIFGNGESVVLADGHIPSMNELASYPERLDALTSFWEPDHTNSIPRMGTPYPSWYYFGASAFQASNVEPANIEKLATPVQEAASPDYGWEYYQQIPDLERTFLQTAKQHTPAPPKITGLHCVDEQSSRRVTLNWEADPLAIGYRVYIGRRSRGWNYEGPSLPTKLLGRKSFNGPWRAKMYPARFQIPPSDLALAQTSGTTLTIVLRRDSPAYFSVMGFDAYGESVGRRLYPLSEEVFVPR